jgi:hypothetical protein
LRGGGGGAALPSGTAEPIRNIYRPASSFRNQESDPANTWSLNAAWRAVLGQCAPSPQACRHTPAPKPTPRFCAAGGDGTNTRQFWSARRKAVLAEGTSPRGLTCHCADKAGYIYYAPLHICRVVLLLLRQRRGAGLVELQRARGRSKYFATASAHIQRALYGAQSSRGWSGKKT